MNLDEKKIMNKLAKYKNIFWDFDGVIKDSVDIKNEAYVTVFENICSAEDLIQIRNHSFENPGISRYEKIPYYLKFISPVMDEVQEDSLIKLYGDIVLEKVLECDWVPGAREYIENFSKKQNFYLVSATPDYEIKKIMTRLGMQNFFHSINGSPSKKVDIVKRIIQEEKISTLNTIFIGDSNEDFIAAKKNNLDFLLRVHANCRFDRVKNPVDFIKNFNFHE